MRELLENFCKFFEVLVDTLRQFFVAPPYVLPNLLRAVFVAIPSLDALCRRKMSPPGRVADSPDLIRPLPGRSTTQVISVGEVKNARDRSGINPLCI